MSRSVPTPARRRPAPAGRSGRPSAEASGPPTGVRRTRRWRGVAGLTVLAIGAGLLVREPALLLASVFGVGFAAYGQIGSPPAPSLAVERSVGSTDPAADPTEVNGGTDRTVEPEAGDRVRVSVAVTNEGESTLPDLRLVDGVPDGLSVVDGSPRLATALRPGETAEVSYVVEATRGAHAFEPLVAMVRDVTGATERVLEVAAGGRIDCVPALPADPPAFPLRAQTTRYTGRTTADEGGPGVEFHATREYRPGDPLARIDWKRTARTGDLTTVDYRLERAASVLLVVDARRAAYAAPDPHDPTAVDRSVEAARQVAAGLLGDGHLVGLAAVGPRSSWLAPGRGVEHRLRLAETLATSDAFERTAPTEDCNVYAACRAIRGRIDDDTQVVFFTPLVDDGAESAAHRFEAHGHRTTVVSPDPCGDDALGERAAGLARSVRVAAIRRAGVPTVDWGPGEPIETALAGSQRRRSR